jgi:hypothetical protein
MPRRRTASQRSASRSAKRKTLLGCFVLVVLAYFALVGRMLSFHATLPSNTDVISLETSVARPKPPLDELVQGWNITGNVSCQLVDGLFHRWIPKDGNIDADVLSGTIHGLHI